jgi:hypothetical protein
MPTVFAGVQLEVPDNIVDHYCEAWNKLVDKPWRIMSIGQRKWVRRS